MHFSVVEGKYWELVSVYWCQVCFWGSRDVCFAYLGSQHGCGFDQVDVVLKATPCRPRWPRDTPSRVTQHARGLRPTDSDRQSDSGGADANVITRYKCLSAEYKHWDGLEV